MSQRGETETGPGFRPDHERGRGTFPVLVLAGNTAEPGRVGEIALPAPSAGGVQVMGRGAQRPDDPGPRVVFQRQRPGLLEPGEPLSSPGLSRCQLLVRFDDTGVSLERVGRLPLEVGGALVDRVRLVPGQTARLGHELLLLCSERSPDVLRPRGKSPGFAAGGPDEAGLVGESPRMWMLRDELSFYATREEHVLVTGPSGTGKELVARALHRQSRRRAAPFVARNAATLPEGVLDAELFGHAKGFPNAGMPERVGLFGEAEGGVLFLDEIGEIRPHLQAHLLRVLDAGEYHRLGETRARRADLRVVAATNRALSELKEDLVARFKLRLAVPPLRERREDIPLLARHLLKRICESDPISSSRLLDGDGEPRLDPALTEALIAHDFTTEIRELEALLLLAVAKSTGSHLVLAAEVKTRLSGPRSASPHASGTAEAPRQTTPFKLDRALIEATLAAHEGSVTRAARALGLADRNVLYRLMKKLDLPAR